MYTPLPRNRKSSRDHRRNKKSRTGTVPQAECMYQQERIHPAKRTNQTCRHRRTEQLHPARVPAPPRNGKVNGLCATRKRHSKRNLGGQAQRHRDIEINLKRISVPLYFRVHPPKIIKQQTMEKSTEPQPSTQWFVFFKDQLLLKKDIQTKEK